MLSQVNTLPDRERVFDNGAWLWTTKGENNEIRGQMLLYVEDGGELEGSLQRATSTLPLQWWPHFHLLQHSSSHSLLWLTRAYFLKWRAYPSMIPPLPIENTWSSLPRCAKLFESGLLCFCPPHFSTQSFPPLAHGVSEHQLELSLLCLPAYKQFIF